MTQERLASIRKRLEIAAAFPRGDFDEDVDWYAYDAGWLLGQLEAAQERQARLRAALSRLVAHMEELAEAWQRGIIHENDGKGGIRSNRNHELAVAARALLEEEL